MKILSLTELNTEQQLAAQALEIVCKSEGGLKCNMHWDKSMNFFPTMRHWFLLYNDGVLMAVLSAFAPTVSQVEFGGYTLPKARRKGCFSLLLDVAAEEARQFGYQHALLITERSSKTGQAFVRHLGALYSNTEYQLVWQSSTELAPSPLPPLKLAVATLTELEPLTELSRSIFGGSPEEARQILETTIHTPHLTQYVATLDGQIVGMVAINFEQTTAWIIGLGVCPDQQGKGFGKRILHQTLDLLRQDSRAETVMIEVDSSNEVALRLYQQAGFVIQMGQDYFKLPL
ncbi:GNAT family N-acetyltransferase [Larkinella insperata]|uniref:GNAT family N-acetyltransferase n=1 Tax=Larkinella insperata TaxID=332158 RepID=A0ABW3QHJ7_9BACT|nr:GNAT family N-acetyltransferase [Larkinella insperata]